jgi:hypothetical protein
MLLVGPLPLGVWTSTEAYCKFGMASFSGQGDLVGKYMAMVVVLVIISV